LEEGGCAPNVSITLLMGLSIWLLLEKGKCFERNILTMNQTRPKFPNLVRKGALFILVLMHHSLEHVSDNEVTIIKYAPK